MEYGYVVKISNKIIYREVQLPTDATHTKIGTELDCDVRFYKEYFFESFALTLKKHDDNWFISCSDNIYLDVGDVRKLVAKPLVHGDSFSVKYQNSESELFKIEFLFDFDNEKKDYSRTVDISSVNSFTIGTGANCSIVLKSTNIKNDLIELTKAKQGLVLNIRASTYGIYINGKKASNGSVIHDIDFFSIAEFSFYYNNNTIKTSKKVLINSLPFNDEFEMGDYPKFIRNARIHRTINEDAIEILDPATKPEKPRANLILSVLPSMGMMLTAGAMMMISGSWTMIVFSGVSASMAIVTAVAGFFDNKKNFKKSIQKRIDDYNDYIARKKEEILKARETEKDQMEGVFFSTEKELDMLYHFSPEIFDRQPTDWDYLYVRLGSGDIISKRNIEHKKQEKLELEDEIQLMPEQVKEEFKLLKKAPVVCDFKSANAICICGKEPFRFELFKNIVFDISIRQFYSDVSLIFVCEEKNKEKIDWLRFLPHVYNDAIKSRNIVCDDDSKTRLFDYLYKELSHREAISNTSSNIVHKNHIIMFMYDKYGFQCHPISMFVKSGSKLGITFVFMTDNKATAPEHCTWIIDVDSNYNGKLINTADMDSISEFNYQPISDEIAKDTVNLLAPIYIEDVSLESSLTKSITFFEMMKILMVEDIDLKTNWENSHVYKSMAAPIGVTKSDYVYLDLHDKAHGPHGLVAGTTGSGKSELLQTYILSVATLYHPYEVSFVIIDFKGGGMVNQFKDLPHLLGAITNIDGKAINRSLKSIKAELQKRQRLFAEAEVNHIDKYIKKYQAGQVSTPIPHLILIVDEFAELKAEQPEFMKELISAARIGRSLGVHLILATQKPSGQVDDQIWSNSRFKLCLKVQSQQDSNEVLKSPLAAEIKEPGRAYLQVGNNEIFELFQSAYSGASDELDDTSAREFSIYEISNSTNRKVVYEQKKKKTETKTTQLSAIVDYVSEYCKNNGIAKLPDICLPALPSVINYTVSGKVNHESIIADIGVYDDPENQYQGVYSVNLTEQNILIVGSAQSGKTTVLQTMIRDLTAKYTSSEVNIYIIDFASMSLRIFDSMKHVGGVVTTSEDEKLKNLMKLLFAEMDTRKEKLLSAGVSSFSAYKEAGYEDLPQIVVMIDNMTALRELYFQDDDSLQVLCREGLSVGISMVIANTQTSGIGYRLMSSFNCKIALFCNDSSEYSSLFDFCHDKLEEIHGRSLIEIDKIRYECQIFLPFEGEKEIERIPLIKSFIEKTNKQSVAFAKRIPVIPETLSPKLLEREYGAVSDTEKLVIGLDYATVMPVFLDFRKQEVLAVTGNQEESLASFYSSLKLSLHQSNAEIYVLDNYTGVFSDLAESSSTVLYSKSIDDTDEILDTIKRSIISRSAQRDLKGISSIDDMQPLVFIINNIDFISKVSSDNTLLSVYKEIFKKNKGLKVLLIFTDIENEQIMFSAPEVLKMLRDSRQFVFFGDIGDMKIIDISFAQQKNFREPIKQDDAIVCSGNKLSKVKFVHCS